MSDTSPESPVSGPGGSAPGSGPDASPGAGWSPPPRPGSHEWQQLRNVLLFLPRLGVLLAKLLADPEVAALDKVLLGAAVLYIASPLDILPDFIPILGQLDDIYLVAIVLLRLLSRSGDAKLRQHWDGPEDIVHVIHTVSDYATRYLPEPVRGAVRGWVDARSGEPPSPAA